MSYLGFGTGGFSGILGVLGESAAERVGEALYWFIKQSKTDEEMPDELVNLAKQITEDIRRAEGKVHEINDVNPKFSGPQDVNEYEYNDISPKFSGPDDVYTTHSDIDMEEKDEILEKAAQAQKDRENRKRKRDRQRYDRDSDDERDDLLKSIDRWEKATSTPSFEGGRRKTRHYCRKHRHCRYCGKRHH